MFKFKQLGMNGSVHSWIKNWLSNNKKKSCHQWHCLGLRTSHEWSSTGLCSRTSPVHNVGNDIAVGLNNVILKFADD